MAAAAEGPAGSLQEEVTRSVCPACGHSRCQACSGQRGGEPEPHALCPQCRAAAPRTPLRPKRQLGDVLELVKRLRLPAASGPEGQRVCERHRGAPTLFCREDEAPVCAACRESRARAAVPMEEAARDYREKIQSCLEHLKDQREELQSLKCTWEQESERLLRQTELERQLVVSECEELRQLLAEQKRLLLTRLEELNTEIVRRREENATRLGKETARLSALITELEEKCHQLGPERLQGVRSAVTRGEEVTPLHPAPKFPEQKRIQTFCGEKKLQEAQTGFLVDVTLDPDTANPNLVLSEDRKCVRHGDSRQDLPDNPERFDPCVFVLGSQGFAGGRHYWEVEVGDKTDWALGVCRESVRKKGQVTFTPGNGYWTVWLWDGAYKALTSPTAPFPVRVQPRRVGVFLDYEAGEVSFYNVTDRSHLFTFTDTFSGTLRPLFCPGINAGGTNAAPLTLCQVPAQP